MTTSRTSLPTGGIVAVSIVATETTASSPTPASQLLSHTLVVGVLYLVAIFYNWGDGGSLNPSQYQWEGAQSQWVVYAMADGTHPPHIIGSKTEE